MGLSAPHWKATIFSPIFHRVPSTLSHPFLQECTRYRVGCWDEQNQEVTRNHCHTVSVTMFPGLGMWVWVDYLKKIPSPAGWAHLLLQGPKGNKYRKWICLCSWEVRHLSCALDISSPGSTAWRFYSLYHQHPPPVQRPFTENPTLDCLVLGPLDMDVAMFLASLGLQDPHSLPQDFSVTRIT